MGVDEDSLNTGEVTAACSLSNQWKQLDLSQCPCCFICCWLCFHCSSWRILRCLNLRAHNFGIFVDLHESHCKFYWTLSPIFTFVTDKLLRPLHKVTPGVLSSGFVTLDHSRSKEATGMLTGLLINFTQLL